MAMRDTESIFDRLPDEIILLVLHELPIKTLVCCTRVCKYLSSLIRNPTFIYSYEANAALDDESFINLCCIPYNESGKIECSFKSRHTRRTKYYILNSSSAFGTLSEKSKIEPVGSCNGLICLRERSCNGLICLRERSIVLLWNPVIRRSFILPETNCDCQSQLGFGFASKDNDYKVLIVNYNQDDKRRHLGLYSLKLNSWRSIDDALVPYSTGTRLVSAPMVFAGGSLHYIATGFLVDERFSYSIVAFDLGNEVFRTIEIPETLRTGINGRLSISEYNGSASIAVFDSLGKNSCLHEVWVMREYGVEDSWLKLSIEDVDYHLPRMPIFYFRTEQRLYVNIKHKVYCPLAYDIDSAGTVSLMFAAPIKSIDDCRNRQMCCYKDYPKDHQLYFYASRHSFALLDK